jgi:hypothetical protein
MKAFKRKTFGFEPYGVSDICSTFLLLKVPEFLNIWPLSALGVHFSPSHFSF